jgi:hypothetical protein
MEHLGTRPAMLLRRVLRQSDDDHRGTGRDAPNRSPATGTFVIVLHHPRGRRWTELVGEPYVDQVAEGLSLPPWVVIRLTEDVTSDQAQVIAEAFMARLDGEPVTVEFRRYE